jgi:hypothetical protein
LASCSPYAFELLQEFTFAVGIPRKSSRHLLTEFLLIPHLGLLAAARALGQNPLPLLPAQTSRDTLEQEY